jgi:hypothetical protein
VLSTSLGRAGGAGADSEAGEEAGGGSFGFGFGGNNAGGGANGSGSGIGGFLGLPSPILSWERVPRNLGEGWGKFVGGVDFYATGTKLLGDDINNLPWKRQLGDVSVLDITEKFPGQKEQVVLQKLVSGGKAPAHTHRGVETTIVLQGAFADQKGVFNQWDFVVLTDQDEHKPVAVGCEDCITLSVLSAPVKLTGTFTRMLNPFIR